MTDRWRAQTSQACLGRARRIQFGAQQRVEQQQPLPA
jgi:hypothetical protein